MPELGPVMVWGSREQSALRSERIENHYELVRAFVDDALNREVPSVKVKTLDVREGESVLDGEPRKGYRVTITFEVESGQEPATPEEARTLECRIESAVAAALQIELFNELYVELGVTPSEVGIGRLRVNSRPLKGDRDE